jgi:hypothetical protein
LKHLFGNITKQWKKSEAKEAILSSGIDLQRKKLLIPVFTYFSFSFL